MVSQVAAYTVTSTQTQEVSSSTELESTSKSSVESSTDVSQEQQQHSNEFTRRKGKDGEQKLPLEGGSKKMEKRQNFGKEDRPEHTASPSAKQVTKCEEIKGKVTNHIAAVTNNYQNREDKYKRIYQTVTELISRLSNKGIDVTSLKNAATNLQTERAQLIVAFDAYIAKAEEIKELSCDASSGDRRARFTELRTARQNYENELQDVGSAINTQLKPALQTVKTSTEDNQ